MINKQVNVIISVIDKFGPTSKAFNDSFKTIIKGAVAAEAAILAFSAAVAVATYKVGKEFVSTAGEYQDAIFNITAITGKFGASQEEVSGILDSLVAKFPVTGKVAGEALESIAQMGFTTAKELDLITTAALELSIATSSQLSTSVGAILPVMNAWGLEVSEVNRITNVFAATQFSSAAAVGDLKEGLKFIAPTASLMGLKLEEVVAVMGKLKDTGLEASQTGTQFRGALINLLKPTDQMAAAMAKYGVTVEDVQANQNSFAAVIDLFKGKQLSAADAAAIFGKRNIALASIVNAGGESLREYTKEITNTTASTDAMIKKNEKWSVVLNNLGGTVDVFKKTLGEGLLTEVINLIGKSEKEGIRGIITQLKTLESDTKGIGEPLINAFKAMKDAGKGIFDDAFGGAEGFYDFLTRLAIFAEGNIKLIAIYFEEFSKALLGSANNTGTVISALNVINAAFGTLALGVAYVHDAAAIMFTGFQYGFSFVAKAVVKEIELFEDLATVIVGFANKIPGIDLTDELKSMQQETGILKDYLKESFDVKEPKLWGDAAKNAMIGASSAVLDLKDKLSDVGSEFGRITVEIDTQEAVSNVKDIEEAVLMTRQRMIDLAAERHEVFMEYDDIEEAEMVLQEIDKEMQALSMRTTELQLSVQSDDALGPLKTVKDELLSVHKNIQELNQQKLTIKTDYEDTKKGEEALKKIEADLNRLEEKRTVLSLELSRAGFIEDISKINKDLKSIVETDRRIKIDVLVDDSEVQTLKKTKEELEIEELQIKIDTTRANSAFELVREEINLTQRRISELNAEKATIDIDYETAGESKAALLQINTELEELERRKTQLTITLNADTTNRDILKLQDRIDELQSKKYPVELEVKLDEKTWGETKQEIQTTYELVDGKYIEFQVAVDKESKKDLINDVDITGLKAKEKLTDYEKFTLQLELEKFKDGLKQAEKTTEYNRESIRNKLKFEAELKIEKMQAAVEVAKAQAGVLEKVFESVGASVVSVSDNIGGMFAVLAGFEGSQLDQWKLWDIMEEQVDLQKELAAAQLELIAAEKEKISLENERLKDPTLRPINVTVEGNAPEWLRGITEEMFKVMIGKARAEAWDCFGKE